MEKNNASKLTLLFLLAISLTCSYSAPAQTLPKAVYGTSSSLSANCALENNTFQAGEQLVYKIYYNWNFVWLPAGEVLMTIEETDDHYQLGAYGKTYKTYEWFYKLRYDYECEMDKENLLPQNAVRRIEERRYSLYDRVDFNRDYQKVISHRGKSADATRRRTFRLTNCTHDLLSLVYYTRNINLDSLYIGQQDSFDIFLDKKVWQLKATYEARDSTKKIKKMGVFDTLHFSSEVMEGKVFKKDSKMEIWVSNDDNKIPLLIEAPLKIGSVKVVLKSYRGLRYHLDAKLESSNN